MGKEKEREGEGKEGEKGEKETTRIFPGALDAETGKEKERRRETITR